MRKICIVGAACLPNSLPLGRGFEYWSVNNLYRGFAGIKFTRWYELHKFERVKNRYIRRGVDKYGGISVDKYLHELDDLGIPVYMQRPWAVVGRSTTFPFKAVMEKYGQYFGCSFAWMIGHVLLEHQYGAKKDRIDWIGFYGVGLEGAEYYYQRPSTEYMIGMAAGLGIEIFVARSSKLLQSPYQYAVNEDFSFIEQVHVGPMSRAITAFAATLSTYLEDLTYGVSIQDGAKNRDGDIPGRNLLD